VRCPDEEASKKMVRLVDRATKEGNSLGGVFEVFATGVPVGLGSHIQWDKRLDGRLARALMSIQAIKGVEIGLGFGMSGSSGSEVMDEIFYDPRPPVARGGSGRSNISGGVAAGFYRKTNNAGGIEGGMTNGMPTLRRPLRSVNVTTKKAVEAAYERSDICAVPAAGVIGEAMVALTVADVFLQKFGGDSMKEVKRNYNSYMQHVVHF
jgi:chorismate synthase